jgi:hypothetical protein
MLQLGSSLLLLFFVCTDFVEEWILKIKMSKDDISIVEEKKTNAILKKESQVLTIEFD